MEQHETPDREAPEGGIRQPDGDPEDPATTPGSGTADGAGGPRTDRQPDQDERRGGYGGSTGGQDPEPGARTG